MQGVFVTATGTEVGKTRVACALASSLVAGGNRVAAIKPIETGCDPDALDANALGAACGMPSLASASGLYRAREPLAPYAVQKRGGPKVGPVSALAERVRELSADVDFALVEGAGGVLVPIDETQMAVDLIAALALPAILVAANELGVQSFTLTAAEALERRSVPLRAVVLNDPRPMPKDLSRDSNREVLADYLPGVTIVQTPYTEDDAILIEALGPVIRDLLPARGA
ncbi:MAG: dethiobiotin synthase [Myxococcota bacterium]